MPHVVRFLVILIIGSRRFGFIVSTLEQPSQLLFWAKKKGKHGNQIGYTYLFFYSWYPTGTKHVHYLFISQLASSQQWYKTELRRFGMQARFSSNCRPWLAKAMIGDTAIGTSRSNVVSILPSWRHGGDVRGNTISCAVRTTTTSCESKNTTNITQPTVSTKNKTTQLVRRHCDFYHVLSQLDSVCWHTVHVGCFMSYPLKSVELVHCLSPLFTKSVHAEDVVNKCLPIFVKCRPRWTNAKCH